MAGVGVPGRGCAWQGSGRGHVWQGACMAGACMAGVVHGRRHALWGHVWWGGIHAMHIPPPQHYEIWSVNVWAVHILLECILV